MRLATLVGPVTVTDLDGYRAEQARETLARLRALAAQAATEDEAREVANRIRAFIRRIKAARWEPYVWQRPHTHPAGWVSQKDARLGVCDDRCALLPPAALGVHEVWVARGGRGTGKTDGAAHYINAHAESPACDVRVPGGHRFTIVGPTQPDAVASCVTGVSGLQSINPAITVTTGKEGTIVRWPNGSVGRILGANTAQDVQRARAWTNVCCWWLEEFAAMPHAGGLVGTEGYTGPPGMLDQAPFTLRLGKTPHMVATTTPTGRPEVGVLLAMPGVQTWGRTRDAFRLEPAVREALERRFPPGTTIGRQELDGERVGDVQGAMWVQKRTPETPADDDRPGIDNDRVPLGSVGWTPHGDVHTLTTRSPESMAVLHRLLALLPPVPENPTTMAERTAVGVDPAGGSTENGISVVGSAHQHGYTLADLSMHGAPATWGMMAALAWYHFGAEGIALERTYGGDQTDHSIITACEELDLPVPAFLRAGTQEGKKARAIPVQTLAQVHRLHHVGVFPRLEGEQTTWVEDETPESPNRLDAWVHAVRHLLVRAKAGSVSTPKSSRRPRTTSGSWAGTRRRG
jgi:phage terminase large subunit-like protein